MIPEKNIINRIKLVLKESKEPLHKTEIAKRILISKDMGSYLDHMVKKKMIKKIKLGKVVGYYVRLG